MCPMCDPRGLRPLPVQAHRTCRLQSTGDHLHALVKKDIGAKMQTGCNCPGWITKMNAWGPAGCREHRKEIIDHMIEEAERRKWQIEGRPILSAAAKIGCLTPLGIIFARHWAGQLVDEAIRLTEAGAAQ